MCQLCWCPSLTSCGLCHSLGPGHVGPAEPVRWGVPCCMLLLLLHDSPRMSNACTVCTLPQHQGPSRVCCCSSFFSGAALTHTPAAGCCCCWSQGGGADASPPASPSKAWRSLTVEDIKARSRENLLSSPRDNEGGRASRLARVAARAAWPGGETLHPWGAAGPPGLLCMGVVWHAWHGTAPESVCMVSSVALLILAGWAAVRGRGGGQWCLLQTSVVPATASASPRVVCAHLWGCVQALEHPAHSSPAAHPS